jgi:hypothetical protein
MAGSMMMIALWGVAPCSLDDSRPHDEDSTRL